MPAADRTARPTREPKTICIPCSQQEYERIVDDPARFREFLDRRIEATVSPLSSLDGNLIVLTLPLGRHS